MINSTAVICCVVIRIACEAVALFLGGLLRFLKNTGGNDAEKNGEGRGKGKNKAPAIMHNKNEFRPHSKPTKSNQSETSGSITHNENKQAWHNTCASVKMCKLQCLRV